MESRTRENFFLAVGRDQLGKDIQNLVKILKTNPKFILADTCFWYALFTKNDQYHSSAISFYNKTEKSNFILPWPILYEVIDTSFIKNTIGFGNFIRILKYPNYIRLDDRKYRDSALEKVEIYSTKNRRNISLVDSVLREILKDTNVKVDFFITYNQKDFVDTIDWSRTEINELQI